MSDPIVVNVTEYVPAPIYVDIIERNGEPGDIGPVGPQGIQGPIGPEGPSGATGPTGAVGADGADGVGVPAGGTIGQVLSKVDGTDPT